MKSVINNETLPQAMWDEENRLKHVYDENTTLSSYLYDAGGERTLKLWDGYQYMMINGQQQIGFFDITDYTLYTSPYMVLTPEQYTKHYYAESDRIVSKIGGGMQNNIYTIGDQIYGFNLISHGDYLNKANNLYGMIQNDYNQLGVQADVNANFEYWLNDAITQDDYEEMIFFYHKNHLGSSTQISDNDANIIQHIEYLPYGELFFERRSYWNTPYKFNAKELDAETGMYYYGARYYTPEVSIWLSVDPLADKYPSMSAFMYCAGNPVIFIDPDGRDWYRDDETGSTFWKKGNANFVEKDGVSYRNIGETHSVYSNGIRIDYGNNGTSDVISVTDVNPDNNTEGGEYIPKQFTTDNGRIVKIDMSYKTKDGRNADNAIMKDAVSQLIKGINLADKNGDNITTIGLSATTNGAHASTSRHYSGKAFDICTIDNVAVGYSSKAKGVQEAMNKISTIRENFGPHLKTKMGLPWNVGGHTNHIHISVN